MSFRAEVNDAGTECNAGSPNETEILTSSNTIGDEEERHTYTSFSAVELSGAVIQNEEYLSSIDWRNLDWAKERYKNVSSAVPEEECK